METDPKQMVANVEEALIKALDKRMAEARESWLDNLRLEMETLRGACDLAPQVLPLLVAAGTNPPDYCQAGTFAMPERSRHWNEPEGPKTHHPVVNILHMNLPEYNSSMDLHAAPFSGVAAATVVRAMSGTGLTDGKKYRYVIMAWAETEENKGG